MRDAHKTDSAAPARRCRPGRLRKPEAASSLLLAAVLFAGRGAFAAELAPDPQARYSEAAEALASGALDRAETQVKELERQLTEEPGWDPAGLFRDQLLPRLRERLEHLGHAEHALQLFLDSAAADLHVPERSETRRTGGALILWGETMIRQLQADREAIVATLPEEADRASLRNTRIFGATEDFLALEIPRRMAAAMDTEISRFLGADERAQILKARLDCVKRDSIGKSDEVQRVQAEAEAWRGASQRLFTLLLDLTGDGGDVLLPVQADTGPEKVGFAFARRLRHQIVFLRTVPGQTPAEKALRMEKIRRLRQVNAVGVDTRLATDQDALIDELEGVVENVPLRSPTPAGGAPPTVSQGRPGAPP